MRPQAPLSPRSGAMERTEGSERAVWPSGRPLRPARIRLNPLNPGQTARSRAKPASQSAVEAVRTPSPYLHPSGKTAGGRPRDPPTTAPALDEDTLQPLDFNHVT